jgi:hypothetical protein
MIEYDCVIAPINKHTIDKTQALVKSVYGDNYPTVYLYNSEALWEKIQRGTIYPFIAIDKDQNAVGMVSIVSLSGNPCLFELGQLMVRPEYRHTNLVNQLTAYLHNTALKLLQYDAIFAECVTIHKLAQRSCSTSGFSDTALKLNMVSGDIFKLENKRRQTGRVSCVVSYLEQRDNSFLVRLPHIYREQISFCFKGLNPREYTAALDTVPEEDALTEYHLNEDRISTARLVTVTLTAIGTDIEQVVQKLEAYAKSNNLTSMLVNIPLGDPHNGAAALFFRKQGFFFGGVMPYWLPWCDALLMQKLYDTLPQWDHIKLFSPKINEIANMIKTDMEDA